MPVGRSVGQGQEGREAERTVREAVGIDDLLRLVDNVRHVDLHGGRRGVSDSARPRACERETAGARTPTTCFAPALAANMLRMPVPHPTSSTVLPANRWLLFTIADRYEPVRTLSLSISSWIPAATRSPSTQK
jgi:hypothetical protein